MLNSAPIRVGIEAAVRFGWNQFLREGETFIGMTSFGASAPAAQLYEHFGITVAAAVDTVESRLSALDW